MAKVFTGNVFITTSKQAMEKVFFSKNILSNYKDNLLTLTEEELKNTYIVSPLKNSNLIEFDFSLGQMESNSQFLSLRFLETDSIFELFFVNKSLNSSLLSRVFSELQSSQLLSAKEKRNLESKIFDSNFNLINDRSIYFSFGIGDSLNNWSGPFTLTLSESKLLTTAEGVKEVLLIFRGNPDQFQSNRIEDEMHRGLDTAVNKYNRILSNRNLIKAESLVEFELSQFPGREHRTISDLISTYISRVSQNYNVIVMLPDMGKIIQKQLDNIEGRRIKAELPPKTFNNFNLLSPLQRNEIVRNLTEKDFWEKKKNDYKSIIEKLNITFTILTEGRIAVPLSLDEGHETAKPTYSYRVGLSIGSDNIDNDEEILPDYYYPIVQFIAGLRPYARYATNQNASDIEFYEETDSRILKLWKTYKFIQDDSKPAILLGSQNLIRNILYLSNVRNLQDALEVKNLAGVHQSDLDLYYNKSYRFDFFNIFLKVPINSSFGEDALIKDELAIDENTKSLIELGNMPVFRYNIRNSNVLGIDVTYNESYIGAYNLAFKKKALLPFINSGLDNIAVEAKEIIPYSTVAKVEELLQGKDLSSFDKILTEIIKLYSEENLIKNPDLLTNLNTEKISLTLNKDQFVIYLSVLINSNFLANDKPYIEMSKEDNEAYLEKEILQQLDKLARQVKIRTVPFFKLAGSRILGKSCLLLSQHNSVIGFENVKKVAVYSGLYTIIGFRHYISTDEMYSEFNLVRDPNDTQLTNILTENGNNQVIATIQNLNKIIEDRKAEINVSNK